MTANGRGPVTLRVGLCMVLSLAIMFAGAVLAPHLLPDLRGPGTGIARRLFYWDAPWYDEIAGCGYTRAPFPGSTEQNLAFFPLYAIVDWLVIKLPLRVGAAVLIVPGLLFGLWSIAAFDRLARTVAPARSSAWATLCFALWPGACFMLMGYPTGLINLCVVNALYHTVRGQHWRGALWSGLGAAAAPTAVFVAIGLCLDKFVTWLQRRAPAAALPGLLGYGLTTVGGLLCFMAFLFFKFGDALAFVKAQDAWGGGASAHQRLVRLLDPVWYGHIVTVLMNIYRFIMSSGRTGPGLWFIVSQYEEVLSVVAFVLAVVAMIAASRALRPRVLILTGGAVVAGYLWFIAVGDQFFVDGFRLLYPASAMFLVFGDWAAASLITRFVLLGGFACLAFAQVMLTTTGYPIV